MSKKDKMQIYTNLVAVMVHYKYCKGITKLSLDSSVREYFHLPFISSSVNEFRHF